MLVEPMGHILVKLTDGRQFEFINTINSILPNQLRNGLVTGSATKIDKLSFDYTVSGASTTVEADVSGAVSSLYEARFVKSFASITSLGSGTGTVKKIELLAGSTTYAYIDLGVGEEFDINYDDGIYIEYTISFSGNQSASSIGQSGGGSGGLSNILKRALRNVLVDGSCETVGYQQTLSVDKTQTQTMSTPLISSITHTVGSDSYYAIKLEAKGVDANFEPYYVRLISNSNNVLDESSVNPWVNENFMNINHLLYFSPAI
jgi:hypothetical protein